MSITYKQSRNCTKIWALLFAISLVINLAQIIVPKVIKHNLKEEQKIAQLQCIEEGIPIDGPALAMPESLKGAK